MVKEQLAVLPDGSLNVYVTSVGPIRKNVFGRWVLLVIVDVPELSWLEGSVQDTVLPVWPKSTVSVMSRGQLMTSGGTSSTVLYL